MMPSLTQDTRLLGVETSLGKDVLVLTGFTGREEMSRLFSYHLEMLSENDAIAPADIVGKTVSFRVNLSDGSPRYFNGFVRRLAAGTMDTGLRKYYAEVVPWLWFLTRATDCRFFQNESVPDIIAEVFDDLGFSDYEFKRLDSSLHKPREYCTQYRETHFDFVSRLLEQEGIYYYFKHEKGKHTMCMSDQPPGYYDLDESEVEYEHATHGGRAMDRILEWDHQYEFRSGAFAQTDYDFKKPSKSQAETVRTIVDLPDASKYELFDYPGDYILDQDCKYTRIRMEEEETHYNVVKGSSTCRTFSPGGKFTITNQHIPSESDKTYAVTSVEHLADEPTVPGESGEVAFEYRNTFTCVPESVPFRPERRTRKSVVQGPQTAVVAGEGIVDTDEYGRVMVHFPWDRKRKNSVRVRVSQNWSSGKWGGLFNPHVGDEVVVDFLEGDPDRPFISGRVYHAERKPPMTLPDYQEQSLIRDHGGNQIKLRGNDGHQQIELYSPTSETQITIGEKVKDFAVDAAFACYPSENGINVRTDDFFTMKIGQNLQAQVVVDVSLNVGGKVDMEVIGNFTQHIVEGDRTVEVLKGKNIRKVKDDEDVEVFGNRKVHVHKNEERTIDGDLKWLDMGNVHTMKLALENQLVVGEKIGVFVGGEVSTFVGLKAEFAKGKVFKRGEVKEVLKVPKKEEKTDKTICKTNVMKVNSAMKITK